MEIFEINWLLFWYFADIRKFHIFDVYHKSGADTQVPGMSLDNGT